MMLGLVAERVLAVEEDIAALVFGCSAGGGDRGGGGGGGGRAGGGDNVTEASLLKKTSDAHQGPGDSVPTAALSATTTAVACAGLPLPLVRWAAHFAAWITQGVVFVVVIAHFFTSQRTCEFAEAPGGRGDNVAPDFVYAIVFCELALFALFGVTQLVQFMAYDTWRNGSGPRCGPGAGARTFGGRRVEAAYIVQSLVSKTLLGWLVYGGNFAPN